MGLLVGKWDLFFGFVAFDGIFFTFRCWSWSLTFSWCFCTFFALSLFSDHFYFSWDFWFRLNFFDLRGLDTEDGSFQISFDFNFGFINFEIFDLDYLANFR